MANEVTFKSVVGTEISTPKGKVKFDKQGFFKTSDQDIIKSLDANKHVAKVGETKKEVSTPPKDDGASESVKADKPVKKGK